MPESPEAQAPSDTAVAYYEDGPELSGARLLGLDLLDSAAPAIAPPIGLPLSSANATAHDATMLAPELDELRS